MSDTWVKICGLQTPADVAVAVESGADAIGVVLAHGSPRTVDAAQAALLVAAAGDAVETVAVVRGQGIDEVVSLARRAGVTTVQLHGDEPPAAFDAVRAAGFAVIRAVAASTYLEASALERAAFGDVRLLLDSPEPGSGTLAGASLTRETAPGGPWILAGGLDPSNVVDQIAALDPTGVDVSSGVESVRGIKDHALIRDFVAAVRA